MAIARLRKFYTSGTLVCRIVTASAQMIEMVGRFDEKCRWEGQGAFEGKHSKGFKNYRQTDLTCHVLTLTAEAGRQTAVSPKRRSVRAVYAPGKVNFRVSAQFIVRRGSRMRRGTEPCLAMMKYVVWVSKVR